MKSLYQKYKPYYGQSLILAVPVVFSQVGHTLVQTADSIIIGHFAGTISLAAVSLVNSIFVIGLVIGLGVSYGITPLIAQSNGRNDHNECGRLLSNSLLINSITGVVLFLFISFGTMQIIGHLDQSPEVMRQARPYLFLMGISLIPLLVFNTFKQFAEGLGFTKQAMVISIAGNVINVLLGITFVKGLFGIKPMGVSGVGYSTLIDRCSMAVVMGVYVFRSKNFRSYLKHFAMKNIDRLRCASILKIGTPVALQYVFEISAFSGAAILIGTISPVAQAAHQVAINLAGLTYMAASGIAAAAAIKSGNFFGAKQHRDLRLSAISNYHIVIIFMSMTALLFTFGNHLLPWMYTTDNAVITIAAQLLIIAAFFQLFDGTQVVGLGILRGMGDVNVPTIITLIAYWVVGLPVGYLLGIQIKMGVTGVWYGLVLGLLTSSLLLFIRFQSISRKQQVKQDIIIAQD
ncbi:MATE family efflux transporter [Mucilaginibacter ginsenosidivorans]|uniref:Multidrug-efflux transporter n=1 Tax=Mucilaginibacter ginsenosidivorans TaxID=398053 RepID=A0A5B8UZ23_9SPHI|nr:MATE family efflux transporter [Mucilaginibacter ginsenosidivorans]QEC64269.1 MATE family efflux transporter [Mucilaginibacter ginsenosidivorans]